MKNYFLYFTSSLKAKNRGEKRCSWELEQMDVPAFAFVISVIWFPLSFLFRLCLLALISRRLKHSGLQLGTAEQLHGSGSCAIWIEAKGKRAAETDDTAAQRGLQKWCNDWQGKLDFSHRLKQNMIIRLHIHRSDSSDEEMSGCWPRDESTKF